MLKFLKVLLLAVGIVLIAATIALMVWNVFQINHLVTTANAANQIINPNPRYWVVLGAAGALLGGFGLGVGLALPKHTFKQRLQAQADQEQATADVVPPFP